MPTALAKPCPSGPVVTSTPGVWPRSGWPGALLPHWRKLLDVVQRQVVAGQVQQAVEQHRAVPGREHEAVAIGPVGIARVVLEEARPQHVGHRRGAERHAGMAAVGLLHHVHRQEADGVDALLVEFVEHGCLSYRCVAIDRTVVLRIHGASLQVQLRISGMSWPCALMYSRCSMSLSRRLLLQT